MRKPVLLEGGGHLEKVVTKDAPRTKKKKFFSSIFVKVRRWSRTCWGEVTAGVAAEKNFLVLTTSETDLG